MIEALWPYLTMAVVAFLSATLLPFSSEAALLGQIKVGFGEVWPLVGAATVGNVGGSLLNWWLGGQIRRFEGQRWFPLGRGQIDAAAARFQRYGIGVLLLSWVPVIGDPLTVIAGVLRIPIYIFLPLVFAGKFARYAVIGWFA